MAMEESLVNLNQLIKLKLALENLAMVVRRRLKELDEEADHVDWSSLGCSSDGHDDLGDPGVPVVGDEALPFTFN